MSKLGTHSIERCYEEATLAHLSVVMCWASRMSTELGFSKGVVEVGTNA